MQILDRNDKLPGGRVLMVQIGIVLAFLALCGGLWQLQILKYRQYATLARHNRIRQEPIPAPRGKIYDRNGHLLVDNYPSFTAYLQRNGSKSWQADLPSIAAGLNLDLDALRARIATYKGSPLYQPIPIKSDITDADQAFIAAHRDDYPELETIMASRRLYPKDDFASHIIGYVGEPSAKQLADGVYQPGDLAGKTGLEAYYDKTLRGVDGERRLLVDARGRVVGTLSDQQPVPGHDLHLTLDDKLEVAAELALGPRPGAIVALNPHTGGVLAMVSHPGYDPNEFAQGLTPAQWKTINDNPDHPMLNKAIQAQLAPGSVFKLVMSVAGLQTNVAENKKVDCTGVYDYHGHTFHCWIYSEYGHGHGVLDITQAITKSCDVYFYTLGNELGIDTIARYAKKLGLGRPTGVDLPGEVSGLVPSPAWKEAHYHQPWYGGETINVSIGQGPVTVTPIQLARLVGGILSGGHFPRPHLNADATDTAGFEVPLTKETVDTIANGMRGVVEPGGTAELAAMPGVNWGGKTGTAQTISYAKLKTISGSHAAYVNNAWFVGVSPVINPDIAVCVLWQRGAEGPFAAQIAGKVIKAYLDEQAAAGQSTGAANPGGLGSEPNASGSGSEPSPGGSGD